MRRKAGRWRLRELRRRAGCARANFASASSGNETVVAYRQLIYAIEAHHADVLLG